MEQFLGFLLVIAVGTAGFFLFRVCRVPSPALLGSMVATGVLNLFGLYPTFPVWALSFVANALVGVMVGKNVDRNVLRRITTLFLPVVIQLVGIFALSLFCGFALYRMTGSGPISLMTALLSGTAGGIAEMLVFGVSANADVTVIALVQLFRVVIFNSLMPYFSLVGRRIGGDTSLVPQSGLAALRMFGRYDYGLLAAFALLGSVLGFWAGVPSGGMLGAMAAAGLFAVCVNRKYVFSAKLSYVAQIGLGAAMGARVTPEIYSQLGGILLPALGVTVVMLTGCTLIAFLLRKVTGWDVTLCLLCAAPAGLSQSAVIAEECGADSFIVATFHSVRIISIVSVYPLIILFLA